MALVAALKTLLHRYAGEDDLRLATNVANRNRAGTEGLIGPLANTVILRTSLGGNPTVREVMRRVRATTLKAYAHQDLPFEVLAETLARERGLDPAQARASDDPASQRRTAAAGERGAGVGLRGGRSRHADAAGDDDDIRCYRRSARDRAGSW